MATEHWIGEVEVRMDERRVLLHGRPIPLGARAFDLLTVLIAHRDRVVTKDELMSLVWPGTVVEENNLTVQISALRKVLGADAIATVTGRGYRLALPVRQGPQGAASDGQAVRHRSQGDGSASTVSAAADIRQDIRFCTAADGVQLAYSVIGAGPPLIKTGNWMTHLEYDLQSPIWSSLYRETTKQFTLARYDSRGNGLSDRRVDEISFDAFVRDLETVVEATGIQRFALLGISQGCAISIAYAVRHPERVSHLVLYGGFAYGMDRRPGASAGEVEAAQALLSLMRVGWGNRNPAFRQMWTSRFLPDGTKEQFDWFNEFERVSVDGDMAARIQEAVFGFNVAALLPRVAVPTLVMHAREDAVVPFEAGRKLATAIPGARFVPLPGRNHIFLASEPAFGLFLRHTREFCAG